MCWIWYCCWSYWCNYSCRSWIRILRIWTLIVFFYICYSIIVIIWICYIRISIFISISLNSNFNYLSYFWTIWICNNYRNVKLSCFLSWTPIIYIRCSTNCLCCWIISNSIWKFTIIYCYSSIIISWCYYYICNWISFNYCLCLIWHCCWSYWCNYSCRYWICILRIWSLCVFFYICISIIVIIWICYIWISISVCISLNRYLKCLCCCFSSSILSFNSYCELSCFLSWTPISYAWCSTNLSIVIYYTVRKILNCYCCIRCICCYFNFINRITFYYSLICNWIDYYIRNWISILRIWSLCVFFYVCISVIIIIWICYVWISITISISQYCYYYLLSYLRTIRVCYCYWYFKLSWFFIWTPICNIWATSDYCSSWIRIVYSKSKWHLCSINFCIWVNIIWIYINSLYWLFVNNSLLLIFYWHRLY